jgi:Uma2 family endonuclease
MASMLPIRFWRPRTHVVGQLGPDAFVALAEDRPRQSYDLMAGENPPAFVLEVLSPASVARDLELKRGAYFELGYRNMRCSTPPAAWLSHPARV